MSKTHFMVQLYLTAYNQQYIKIAPIWRSPVVRRFTRLLVTDVARVWSSTCLYMGWLCSHKVKVIFTPPPCYMFTGFSLKRPRGGGDWVWGQCKVSLFCLLPLHHCLPFETYWIRNTESESREAVRKQGPWNNQELLIMLDNTASSTGTINYTRGQQEGKMGLTR